MPRSTLGVRPVPFALALGVALAGGTLGGCSGGSSPPPLPPGSHCAAPASAPGNLDLERCASVIKGADGGSGECAQCCTAAGFAASSFINDGHCTCGKPVDSNGDVVCVAQSSSATTCGDCCDHAGFLVATWAANVICSCKSKSDPQVCACALEDADPTASCARCCLGQGFISDAYVGVGQRECGCIGP